MPRVKVVALGQKVVQTSMTSVVTEGEAALLLLLSPAGAEDHSAGGAATEDCAGAEGAGPDGAGPVGAGREDEDSSGIWSTGFFQWARAPVARAAIATAVNRMVTEV